MGCKVFIENKNHGGKTMENNASILVVDDDKEIADLVEDRKSTRLNSSH